MFLILFLYDINNVVVVAVVVFVVGYAKRAKCHCAALCIFATTVASDERQL